MRIEIHSTDALTEIDGVTCRVWHGLTEGGNPVYVFVHRLCAHDPMGDRELAAKLSEQETPVELLFLVMRIATGDLD